MPIVTIRCPHCGFSKDLDAVAVPPDGTNVTCPKCRGCFSFARPKDEPEPVFSYNVVSDAELQSPLPSFSPPPSLLPKQNQPHLQQTHAKSTIKARPVGSIIGILAAVIVLAYGISIGYTKLTAKRSADNWGMLRAIASGEQSERLDLHAQVEQLILASDYNGLDKMADTFRASKETFADGEWKLSVFYEQLANYLRKRPEEDWVNRLDRLKAWVAAKPESITARVALAECLIGYAFHGRGAAYANEVREEQWRLLRERLQEARNVLDQAKGLQQKCPGWWAAQLRLATGADDVPWSQYNELLTSAIAYEPAYTVFYFRATWHLLPWWFGNEGDWEDFAKSAADRVGGDEGDVLYTRMVWFLSRRAPQDVVTQNPRIRWDRVDRGIQLLKKRY